MFVFIILLLWVHHRGEADYWLSSSPRMCGFWHKLGCECFLRKINFLCSAVIKLIKMHTSKSKFQSQAFLTFITPALPRRLRFSSFPLHRTPRIDRKTHELPLFVDRFNYGKLYYWDVSWNDESVREMNCRCDVCVRCKHELNFNEFDQMIKLNFLSRSTEHGRHDRISPGDLLAVGNNSGLLLWCFCYIVQMENIYSFSLWWWWSAGNLIRFSMELSLAGSYNSRYIKWKKHFSYLLFCGTHWRVLLSGGVTEVDGATCKGFRIHVSSNDLQVKLALHHIFHFW